MQGLILSIIMTEWNLFNISQPILNEHSSKARSRWEYIACIRWYRKKQLDNKSRYKICWWTTEPITNVILIYKVFCVWCLYHLFGRLLLMFIWYHIFFPWPEERDYSIVDRIWCVQSPSKDIPIAKFVDYVIIHKFCAFLLMIHRTGSSAYLQWKIPRY